MYRLGLFYILVFFSNHSISGQQLNWADYENDTLVSIGTYILADEKIFIPRDTLLMNERIYCNIAELEVKSFVMTAFSIGKEFREEASGNEITVFMKNAIRNREINYKYVNFKDFKLVNLSGDIYVPEIEKIKVIITD